MEKRIKKLRRPQTKRKEPKTQSDKEMENLKRLLTASGEVIATLEDENNHLNGKAYKEVAEGLVVENESLLLKIKQMEEKKIEQNNASPSKSVSFSLDPEQNIDEREENLDEEEIGDEDRDVEEVANKHDNNDAEFRQQSGRVTFIVCGVTRNTKSHMAKHMKKHEEEGESVPPGQVHCGLVAFPECPFQCSTKYDLMKHIQTAHKRQKCNFCSETFGTKEGLDKHRKKTHPPLSPVVICLTVTTEQAPIIAINSY